jgi:MerR family transcriptional regulator, thiopeptide resistance regulator
LRIRHEADAITQSFVEVMRRGQPAVSADTVAVARAHRAYIARTYCALTPDMHRGLGEMYVADQRFAKTYDEAAPGLAVYVRDAIVPLEDRMRTSTLDPSRNRGICRLEVRSRSWSSPGNDGK